MEAEAKKALLAKVKKDPAARKTPGPKGPVDERIKPEDLPQGIPLSVNAHLPEEAKRVQETAIEPTAANARKPISVQYEGVKVLCEFTKNGWVVEFDIPDRPDAYMTPTLLRQLERHMRYEMRLYQRGLSTKRRLKAASKRSANEDTVTPQVKETADAAD